MVYSDYIKSPLYQLRFMYNFNIPELIRATGLPHIPEVCSNPFDRAMYGLPIQRVYAEQILLAVKRLTREDSFTYEQLGIVLEDESLPTFRQVVEQHHLTLADIAKHAGLPLAVVSRIDEKAEGTPCDLSLALASLHTLSGVFYAPCQNIRGFLYLKQGQWSSSLFKT